jgi:hypothetical protein
MTNKQSDSLSRVFKLLTRLAPDELKQVADRVSILRNIEPPVLPPETDWLKHGIFEELRRLGILAGKVDPDIFQTARLAASHYGFHASNIKEGLINGLDFKPQPHHLAALGVEAAHALAAMIKKAGRAPVCLNVMLYRTDSILAAVDESYPGYIAAKKLGLLIKKRKKDGP